MAKPRVSRFSGRRLFLAAASCVLAPMVVSCSSEDAVPLDQYTEPTESTLVGAHVFKPTQQMVDLASQQCIDDPALAEGVVEAVDSSSGDVLGESRVDCNTVRG